MYKRGYQRRPNSGGSNRGSFSGGSGNSRGGTDRFRGRGGNRSFGNRRGKGRGPQGENINPERYISKELTQEQKTEAVHDGISFESLGLDKILLENLDRAGFKTTTEIQTKTIPFILKGNDLLGISKTGSGKTGAFLIPFIQKLIENKNQELLVIAPTRELVNQIAKEAINFLRGTGIFVSIIVGGESMNKQASQIKKGSRIVIGTPGRLMDLMDRKILKPQSISNVVLDEVDRMLDMGFIDDVKKIFSQISQKKQTLYFSATLKDSIKKIVDSLSTNYEIVKLSNNTANTSVVQSVIDFTHSDQKIDLLTQILNKEDVAKAIIFVETKRYADQIGKIIRAKGHKIEVIHGDKRQSVRNRVISMFRDSKIDFLIATNVAARGIDIDDITHVINLDEPKTYDEYIHRIGRTGRNGRKGVAYTFVKRR